CRSRRDLISRHRLGAAQESGNAGLAQPVSRTHRSCRNRARRRQGRISARPTRILTRLEGRRRVARRRVAEAGFGGISVATWLLYENTRSLADAVAAPARYACRRGAGLSRGRGPE